MVLVWVRDEDVIPRLTQMNIATSSSSHEVKIINDLLRPHVVPV